MQTIDIQINHVNTQLKKLQEVKEFLESIDRARGKLGFETKKAEPEIRINKYWQEY